MIMAGRVAAPPLAGFALASWTVGIAVHQSHRDLAYALDDAVAAALAELQGLCAFYKVLGAYPVQD